MTKWVDVKVDGLKELRNEFKHTQNIVDKASFNTIAARVFFKRVKQNFDTEGKTNGGKWAPLSKMRQRDRQLEGVNPKHPILNTHGDLKRVATSWMNDNGPRISMSVNGDASSKTWTLQGDKVVNHYGYRTRNKAGRRIRNTNADSRRFGQFLTGSQIPARPFWPELDAATVDGMAKPVEDFLTHWADNTLDKWVIDWKGANVKTTNVR